MTFQSQIFSSLTVYGKKKDWQHKSDISLYVMKPTIVTCNFFYLKIIIFWDIIGQRKKCLTLKSQKVVIFWDGGSSM